MGDVPGQARYSRTQIVLGCIGLVLFAIGVLMATVTARREWAAAVGMPAIRGPAGQSVATATFGRMGPVGAGLEVASEGGVLRSSRLSRNVPSQGDLVQRVSGAEPRMVFVGQAPSIAAGVAFRTLHGSSVSART